MKTFNFTSLPSRVIFGKDSLVKVKQEIEFLGAKRALVLCTPEQIGLAKQVMDLLGESAAGIFDRAVMHVPIETAEEARRIAKDLGADSAVAVGGGSTTGLGKAIALVSNLPIVAIPTTYAGSEMTPIYGITDAGVKKTGRDPRVLPKSVIYDPALTLGLPAALSITSGINAIAHAAEGLYAHDGNPIMNLLAAEGMASMFSALPEIHSNPVNLNARSNALYGAWLCGTVLGHVGMSLHHKLCHTLGGTFNLPHAETHTVVLPHALAYNAKHATDAMQIMAKALNVADAPLAIYQLAKSNGAPVALRDIGMLEKDLDQVCHLAMQNQYPNPRPLEQVALRQLLQNAFEGEQPQS